MNVFQRVIHLKLAFITPSPPSPILIHTRTYTYQGVRNASSAQIFAYTLNEWSQSARLNRYLEIITNKKNVRIQIISKLIQIIGKKFQILLKINSTMDIFFDTMRENVQIRSFFWSLFSRIRTEYGPKKLRIWTL